MLHHIQIRRYQPQDVDAVYAAVMESKAELSVWMPWCHEAYSRDDTQTWVGGRAEAWQAKSEWSFVVVNSDGQLLGAGGIHRIDTRNGVAEMGYWVRTSMTRQGIATAATRLMCEWAFNEAGLHRVEILAAVENVASQRVAEKAGATYEGILKQRLLVHNRRHDCSLFAITANRT